MPVVIQEFEAVTTPPPAPRASEPAAAPTPLDPSELKQLLRVEADRELRLAAD